MMKYKEHCYQIISLLNIDVKTNIFCGLCDVGIGSNMASIDACVYILRLVIFVQLRRHVVKKDESDGDTLSIKA